MKRKTLFREEVGRSRTGRFGGGVLLTRPKSFAFITWAALALTVAVILILRFASYPRKTTVAGQVTRDGTIRLHAPQNGVLTKKSYAEGAWVAGGTPIYEVSYERHSSLGDSQKNIYEEIERRTRQLIVEQEKTVVLNEQTMRRTNMRISHQVKELSEINVQINTLDQRNEIATEIVSKYKNLAAADLISAEQYQLKQQELLEVRARISSLRRERIAAEREIQNLRSESIEAVLKGENLISQLQRSIGTSKQELQELEAKRSTVIRAPIAGVITEIQGVVGSPIDPAKPLALLTPGNAAFQVELFIPTSGIGFISIGDEVRLRYPAFPYQKFGQHKGKIVFIADSASLGDELTKMGAALTYGKEPVYRVLVALEQDTFHTYGQKRGLHTGMLAEADVLQESRYFYEWILEPLTSVTGRI